jgi:hypothetical protein
MFCFLGGLKPNNYLSEYFYQLNTVYMKIKNMSPLFVVTDLEQSWIFIPKSWGLKLIFVMKIFMQGSSRMAIASI